MVSLQGHLEYFTFVGPTVKRPTAFTDWQLLGAGSAYQNIGLEAMYLHSLFASLRPISAAHCSGGAKWHEASLNSLNSARNSAPRNPA